MNFNPFPSILKSISTYVSNRQEQSKIKLVHKNEIDTIEKNTKLAEANAKIEFAKTGQSQDFNLDRIAMENMEKSYKDEFMIIIFLTPMIMAFIPQLSAYALKGFEVIAKMPTWYTIIIIGMVVVTFGMRGMLKAYLSRKISLSKPQVG